MAGYSGTPLDKKLGLKPNQRIAIIGAPRGFDAELGPLPRGVTKPSAPKAALDYAHIFVTDTDDLSRSFAPLASRLEPAGMLWVSWPKKSSKVETDLDENVIRRIGLEAGLVDVKVCAVNGVWSGLKFVRRLKDR
ncbi:MAG: DUF3052 domain-containing protein [Gemmatimonadaceae bacterium]